MAMRSASSRISRFSRSTTAGASSLRISSHLSEGKKVLSEEQRPAENIYVQKMERERLEKAEGRRKSGKERFSNIAYNITDKACTPVKDASAPVYITIGDGGNIEGLANSFVQPQPEYSAYREASFGHATLEIKNRTHAYYAWHRNQDGMKSIGDSAWFYNRYWHPDE